MNDLTVDELREFASTITPGPRFHEILVGERVWELFKAAVKPDEPPHLRGIHAQPPLLGVPVRRESTLDPHAWMLLNSNGDPISGGFIT